MAKIARIRRGTSAENDVFTGAIAELTVDTTDWHVRLHDGVTQGGRKIPMSSDIITTAGGALTGNLSFAPFVSIAGASLMNLEVVPSNNVIVTTAADIVSFGNVSSGNVKNIIFREACTIRHSATMELPGGTDILTVSGDSAVFMGIGGNVWKCMSYTRYA